MSARCDISVSRETGHALIRVSGRLEEHDCGLLAAAIRGAAGTKVPRIIIDLEGVDYISSAVIGQIVAERKALPEAGQRIMAVTTSARIRGILSASGIDRTVALFDNLDAALAAPVD
ncbi:MAG TPA: STAS domain-containing protein [Planctomycetota bacterium]|nr:STAS domain-containing protein [Planctomycetota bacterium]